CVKEFESLPNIHIACANEGFPGLSISYLGGFWILIEFDSPKSCEKFKLHEGINSWFSSLLSWTPNFEVKERVVWIDIEGIPLRDWSQNNFGKIARKWGKLVHLDNSNVPNKYSMRICVKTKFQHIIIESFKVILEGKVSIVRAKEVTGWAPDFSDDSSTSDDGSVKLSEATLNWDSENEVEVVEDSYKCHAKVSENEGNSNVVPPIETLADPKDHVPISSGDPFGLEDLIRNHPKNLDVDVPNHVSSDPVFPPGFTPKNNTHEEVDKEQVADNTSLISCNKESNINKSDEGNKMAKTFSNPNKSSKQDFSDSMVRGSIITSMGEHNVVK
ncbi:RNA-directed DNA polymerase, eukaryota, partial [Tanacetum coccineum]